ncbi:MAG: hypothetical protein IKU32_09150, partial [Clostridia bacterium]|nr:hypothetical protein [Clostridia bacterium]
TTSSSRTALTRGHIPGNMPSRSLRRSSSPLKIVACALDFVRYLAEKLDVLAGRFGGVSPPF